MFLDFDRFWDPLGMPFGSKIGSGNEVQKMSKRVLKGSAGNAPLVFLNSWKMAASSKQMQGGSKQQADGGMGMRIESKAQARLCHGGGSGHGVIFPGCKFFGE